MDYYSPTNHTKRFNKPVRMMSKKLSSTAPPITLVIGNTTVLGLDLILKLLINSKPIVILLPRQSLIFEGETSRNYFLKKLKELPGFHPGIEKNLSIYSGSIYESEFGIPYNQYKFLINQTMYIVDTSISFDYLDYSNIDKKLIGIENLLNFARLCADHRLLRFDLVSSIYVDVSNGSIGNIHSIIERKYTKARDELQLPITIIRTSVIADSILDRINIYLNLWKTGFMFFLPSNSKSIIDITTIEHISKSLIQIREMSDTIGQVINISMGSDSLSIGSLSKYISREFSLVNQRLYLGEWATSGIYMVISLLYPELNIYKSWIKSKEFLMIQKNVSNARSEQLLLPRATNIKPWLLKRIDLNIYQRNIKKKLNIVKVIIGILILILIRKRLRRYK